MPKDSPLELKKSFDASIMCLGVWKVSVPILKSGPSVYLTNEQLNGKDGNEWQSKTDWNIY